MGDNVRMWNGNVRFKGNNWVTRNKKKTYVKQLMYTFNNNKTTLILLLCILNT